MDGGLSILQYSVVNNRKYVLRACYGIHTAAGTVTRFTICPIGFQCLHHYAPPLPISSKEDVVVIALLVMLLLVLTLATA